jgi:IPT/TIG domain-containing protein
MRTPGLVFVALLALHVVACGSSSTPNAPTQTVGTTVTANPVGTASVTSLSPNMGSTGGATEVLIKGAGLGATVTFGGVAVQGSFDSRSPNAVMLVYTPPHAAGIVDIVVSSLIGGPVTLPKAFTYAAPEAFDFNGSWSGFGNNGQDTPILFTIRNNLLISAECQGWPGLPGRAVSFSPPVPLTNSEFSYASEDGVVFSGRIVAPNMASGVIRLGPCTSDAWYADKQ